MIERCLATECLFLFLFYFVFLSESTQSLDSIEVEETQANIQYDIVPIL